MLGLAYIIGIVLIGCFIQCFCYARHSNEINEFKAEQIASKVYEYQKFKKERDVTYTIDNQEVNNENKVEMANEQEIEELIKVMESFMNGSVFEKLKSIGQVCVSQEDKSLNEIFESREQGDFIYEASSARSVNLA